MRQDILTNLAFMLSLREALSLGVSFFNENINEQNQLKTKFLKTATDYEILNYVIEGKFPKEKQNLIQESILLDEMKIILSSSSEILEVLGESETDNLVKSLIPLSESNLSSSSIVLDFLIEGGFLDGLKQLGTDIKTGNNTFRREFKRLEQENRDSINGARNRNERGLIYQKIAREASRRANNTVKFERTPIGKASKPVRDYYHDNPIQYSAIAHSATATALAAAGIYAAYKIYKRYFTKAGKVCGKYKGEEKKSCIKHLRVQAIEHQIVELKKNLDKCSTSNNPEVCKKMIEEKIEKLEETIKSIKERQS